MPQMNIPSVAEKNNGPAAPATDAQGQICAQGNAVTASAQSHHGHSEWDGGPLPAPSGPESSVGSALESRGFHGPGTEAPVTFSGIHRPHAASAGNDNAASSPGQPVSSPGQAALALPSPAQPKTETLVRYNVSVENRMGWKWELGGTALIIAVCAAVSLFVQARRRAAENRARDDRLALLNAEIKNNARTQSSMGSDVDSF